MNANVAADEQKNTSTLLVADADCGCTPEDSSMGAIIIPPPMPSMPAAAPDAVTLAAVTAKLPKLGAAELSACAGAGAGTSSGAARLLLSSRMAAAAAAAASRAGRMAQI